MGLSLSPMAGRSQSPRRTRRPDLFDEEEEAPDIRANASPDVLNILSGSRTVPDLPAPPPSRRETMEGELTAMDKPRRLRDRLLTALIDAAPMIIGGIAGGEAGLTGGGQATSESIDYRQAKRERRRGELHRGIEAERGRETEIEREGEQRVFQSRLAKEREESESRRHGELLGQRERESQFEAKERTKQKRLEIESRAGAEQEKREIENRRLDEQKRHNQELESARRDALSESEARRAESNRYRQEGLDFRRYMGEDRARGDYDQDIKPFKEVWSAKKRLDKAAQDDTGASDVAILYNIIKVMDPESVVREGELALAKGAGTWIDTIKTTYNRSLGRTDVLSPQVRKEFIDIANKYYVTAMEQKRDIDKKYEGIALGRGYDPRNVVSYYYGYDGQQGPAASGPPPGAKIHTYESGRQAWWDEGNKRWVPIVKQ